MNHYFISYSNAESDSDAIQFAFKLADKLKAGPPTIDVWIDDRSLHPGNWDEQVSEAIKTCKCFLFVISPDSVAEGSICTEEWDWALRYKKTVLPLVLYKDVDVPFRLSRRKYIDFTDDFEVALAQLRNHLAWLDSPDGVLQSLHDRFADAKRDLRRNPENKKRIRAEIEELTKQIESQEKIVANPKGAEEQTQKNIEAGLERERQPEKPVAYNSTIKFINPPPGIAPTYFQDRAPETKEVVRFLRDDSQRLLTIVGRGGVGKTAMVCRLLKHLENGTLPDDLAKTFGEIKVDGIVYLSESSNHRVNFANIFAGLSKLLTTETANSLDALYKNPQVSSPAKMSALLDQFSAGKVILLLDNVEPLINVETFNIGDTELDESLCTFLHGAYSGVKIILTTRISPRGLNLCEPGRQRILTLDEGLESPYAENILREMDVDGKMGLKNAPDAILAHAREHTRGYPRALEALFAILASDRYTSLEEILTTAENYLPDSVVQSLVGEAFSRLDANAQKVMQALAIYNRPVVATAVDYLLARNLPGVDSAPVLNRLVNMQFVRRERGRYYLHPIDREFALGRIPTQESEIGLDQKSLIRIAANYFLQARKPRAEWKKLDDLSAQLAEFDLRCEAGDYNSAAGVLDEINFDYLFLWGHYRFMIELNEKLQGKISDSSLNMFNLNILGSGNAYIGKVKNAIFYQEQALSIAREIKDRINEGVLLCNLGNRYIALGDERRAIEFYEQALFIALETGNRRSEEINLSNLGSCYFDLNKISKALEYFEKALVLDREIGAQSDEAFDLVRIGDAFLNLGELQKARENYIQAIEIADGVSFSVSQQSARAKLALSYLLQNDLPNARTTIEAAIQYDVPQYNDSATVLHGIIALRQGEVSVAYHAFTHAIAQADELLTKTPDFYDALDAKGLALCGLALCDNKKHIPTSLITFRAARKIAPHVGVVKGVLQLFDELTKCDKKGGLKEVRKAAEGKE